MHICKYHAYRQHQAMPSSQMKEGATSGGAEVTGEKAMIVSSKGGKDAAAKDAKDTKWRLKCYYCHKPGHKGLDCWKRQKKEAKKEAKKASKDNEGEKSDSKALVVASGSTSALPSFSTENSLNLQRVITL